MTFTFLRECCFTNFTNSGILKLKCSCCFYMISTGQIKMLYFFFFLKTKSFSCGFWFCRINDLLYFSFYHLSNSSKSLKSCNSFTLMLLSYFLGLPTGCAVSSFFLGLNKLLHHQKSDGLVLHNVSIEVCFRFILAVSFCLKNYDTLFCDMISYQLFKQIDVVASRK